MGDPMANVTGGTRKHPLVGRVTSLGAAVATAVTMLFVVITGATASSAAQINFQAIVCPILLALRAAFGNFFGLGAIFNGLLAAFGCSVPSGTP